MTIKAIYKRNDGTTGNHFMHVYPHWNIKREFFHAINSKIVKSVMFIDYTTKKEINL